MSPKSKRLARKILRKIEAFQERYCELAQGAPLCYGFIASREHPACSTCAEFKSCAVLTRACDSDPTMKSLILANILRKAGISTMVKATSKAPKKASKVAPASKKGKKADEDEDEDDLDIEDDDLDLDLDEEEEEEEKEEEAPKPKKGKVAPEKKGKKAPVEEDDEDDLDLDLDDDDDDDDDEEEEAPKPKKGKKAPVVEEDDEEDADEDEESEDSLAPVVSKLDELGARLGKMEALLKKMASKK